MGWMRHADTGPTAGRLIVALFGCIEDDTKLKDSLASPGLSWAAIWVKAMLDAVYQWPELIENLEQHLLPELLRVNHFHIEELLRALPIEDLCRGNIDRLTKEDLRLCLAVMGVVEDLGASYLLDNVMNGVDLHDLSYTQRVSTKLLVHGSAAVRISALKSLTYSSSSTIPLPSYLLVTLQQVLPCFHAEPDSAARNEFCSIVKKLFLRIQGVLHRLTKALSVSADIIRQPEALMAGSFTKDSESLQDHELFMSWYMELLLKELQPMASYPRHISALKVLQLLYASGLYNALSSGPLNLLPSPKTSQLIKLYPTSLIHLLLDLVMDAFDDVRSMAASLLHEHYSMVLAKQAASTTARPDASSRTDSDPFWNHSTLDLVLQRSEGLSRRSGRADYADGVGRLYHLKYLLCGHDEKLYNGHYKRHLLLEKLISDLEIDIQIAHDNIQTAIMSAPLHGHLIAFRHIVSNRDFFRLSEFGPQDWRRMHNRLVHSCSRTWTAVKGILCYDSPEGHVIVESEEDESDIDVKDALSYSWRALKETSALIHAMISNVGYSPPSADGGLTYEDLKILGDLTLTQLAELRHRGAFSTVSQTFLACCIRCATSDDSEITKLASVWYNETLICIEEKAAALTRRSAGLPAMITGLLGAHPHGALFERAILDLHTIANAPVELDGYHTDIRLSQVHALNCLKDIFTNSRLGPSTETHLPKTLVIAVNSLEKNIWAIRNCGLMLLKALLTRLVGGTGMVSRSGSQSHLPGSMARKTYEKYPVLADLVLRLLQHESAVDPHADGMTVNHDKHLTAPHSIQMVFPAMEIIDRIGIAPNNELLVEQLLLTHLDSPVWNLRDKAAAILSRRMEKKALISNLYTLMEDALRQGRVLPQNALHGRLLCIKYIIEGRQSIVNDRAYREDLSVSLDGLLCYKTTKITCPISAAILLDIERFIVEALLLGRFEDILQLGRYCLLAGDIGHIELLPSREGNDEDLLQKWKHTVQVTCQHIADSRIYMTDALISALARGRVLSALLEDLNPDCELTTLNVLQSLDNEIAFKAGIQCLNRMQGIFDPLRLQPLRIYIILLQQSIASDSRLLLMEGLSALLSSFEQSVGVTDLAVPMPVRDEYIDLVSWEEQEPMTSPETANATLKLRGALLAHAYRFGSIEEDSDMGAKLELWARMLKLGGDVKSDLSTRLAAAASVDYFKTILRPGHSEPCSLPAFLSIYLVLYTILLDDDEDVRDIGALVVSWIFASPNSSHEPVGTGSMSLCSVVAVEKLVKLLTTSYRESKLFVHEALSRLTGEEPAITHVKRLVASDFVHQGVAVTFLSPVRDLFKIARQEDSSLFVEEKQNLYIDPVQESQRWASVLVHISPTTLDDFITSSLIAWVLVGLECLLHIADQEVGGPIGLMSKPEIFTLGVRVLEAARVIRYWEQQLIVRHNPSLEGLLIKLKRADIHPMWLSRVPQEQM
ncbi:hypothetical protein MMC11_004141 [Xylographa trunciseda]|nr:hypothetical protein [Xylographa trunciseda]